MIRIIDPVTEIVFLYKLVKLKYLIHEIVSKGNSANQLHIKWVCTGHTS